jgi:hypothetical protein
MWAKEPRTDNIPVSKFDGVATQRGSAVLAYLPNLSQKACHKVHVERPKDD